MSCTTQSSLEYRVILAQSEYDDFLESLKNNYNIISENTLKIHRLQKEMEELSYLSNTKTFKIYESFKKMSDLMDILNKKNQDQEEIKIDDFKYQISQIMFEIFELGSQHDDDSHTENDAKHFIYLDTQLCEAIKSRNQASEYCKLIHDQLDDTKKILNNLKKLL
jgi:hypothetical protein